MPVALRRSKSVLSQTSLSLSSKVPLVPMVLASKTRNTVPDARSITRLPLAILPDSLPSRPIWLLAVRR